MQYTVTGRGASGKTAYGKDRDGWWWGCNHCPASGQGGDKAQVKRAAQDHANAC